MEDGFICAQSASSADGPRVWCLGEQAGAGATCRVARALPPRRNVAPSERMCAPTATQCGTIGAHVRSHCDAMWHRRRAHALLLRRNVAPSARTCAPTATQRGTIGAHVRSHCDATWHHRSAHALRPCRNVAQRYATARMLLQALYFGLSSRWPLTATSTRPILFSYKVEGQNLRFWRLTAVRGS